MQYPPVAGNRKFSFITGPESQKYAASSFAKRTYNVTIQFVQWLSNNHMNRELENLPRRWVGRFQRVKKTSPRFGSYNNYGSVGTPV
jgi:hypothetical protein